MDMAQSFQVAPPDAFVFTKPNEWPKWIRRFERYRLASGMYGKPDAMQVNALVYAMGDEADAIMALICCPVCVVNAATRVNPIDGCRQEGATEDGGSSSDQTCGHTYGLVCVYGRRGQAQRGRRKGDT